MNSGGSFILHFDINDILNLFLLSLEFTFIPKGWMGGLRFPQPVVRLGGGDGENLSREKSGQWDPGFFSPDKDKSYYVHCPVPSPMGSVR